MATSVFLSKTTDGVSPHYRVNGILQVDIAGVLGGADVITWYLGANNIPTVIKTCSWRTSASEVLLNSDGGQQLLNNRDVYFEIANAGVNTNISLIFDVQ
jgi:hypothetical protein